MKIIQFKDLKKIWKFGNLKIRNSNLDSQIKSGSFQKFRSFKKLRLKDWKRPKILRNLKITKFRNSNLEARIKPGSFQDWKDQKIKNPRHLSPRGSSQQSDEITKEGNHERYEEAEVAARHDQQRITPSRERDEAERIEQTRSWNVLLRTLRDSRIIE